MRLTLGSGSLFQGLAVIGSGASAIFPEKRWIGWILVLVGVLSLIFDLHVERGQLTIGSTSSLNGRIRAMWPQILMGVCFAGFIIGLTAFLQKSVSPLPEKPAAKQNLPSGEIQNVPNDIIDGVARARAGAFPGGGGDGGGRGQLGGIGGAGLLKVTYAPKFVPEPPKTPFDLYQREAYGQGYASRETFFVEIAGQSKVGIEATLSWGFECQPKTLWIFVHDGANVEQALYAFLPRYESRLKKLDVQARAGITSPCNAGVTPREGYVPISPTIYAFHVLPLSSATANSILRNYSGKNLNLVLRGPEYFNYRRQGWTPEDSQKANERSPHTIYMPGDV